jgi:hypothetical protein
MMTPDVPATMRDISAVRNDLAKVYDHIYALEESNRQLHREMALMQEGVKERLNVYGVLLSRLEAALAGAKLE